MLLLLESRSCFSAIVSREPAMKAWIDFAHHTMRRVTTEQSGGVAVLTALSLTGLLGFAGLGTEATMWYTTKRNMQGAADAAAFSAGTAFMAGQNITGMAGVSYAVATNYGLTNGSNGVTVTVNNPPKSGNYISNASAVEVIVNQPQQMLFSQLFLSSAPVISTRAVALAGAAGTGCVLALDKGDITDVSDNGKTTVDLNACSMYINSPSSSALNMVGQATINAYATYINGNYSLSGQAQLNDSKGTYTGAPQIADPYAGVPIPSFSGCDKNNYSVSGGTTKTLSPGVYCGGISVTGNSTINLSPGTYIMDQGLFTVGGGSSVTGDGVTIVLTSSSGSNYAAVKIDGGAIINLNNNTPGPVQGLTFFQDRNASTSGTNSFEGGTTQQITGALYFPSQTVKFAGGTDTGLSTCTQLIALKITFDGNAALNNSCANAGVKSIGASQTQLVE
jgi:hypothetical protein